MPVFGKEVGQEWGDGEGGGEDGVAGRGLKHGTMVAEMFVSIFEPVDGFAETGWAVAVVDDERLLGDASLRVGEGQAVVIEQGG